VAEAKVPGFLDVPGLHRGGVSEGGRGAGGAQDGEFGPHSFEAGGGGALGEGEAEGLRGLDFQQSGARRGERIAELTGWGGPFREEGFRGVIEGEAAAADFNALLRGEGVRDGDAVGKAVGELGAQVPLIRVHGCHKDVASIPRQRETIAFEPVDAGGGRIQEQVGEGIGEQVDFIKVQHAVVGRFKKAGLGAPAARLKQVLRLDGAEESVFGHAKRDLHKRGCLRAVLREECGKAPGQGALGAAPVAEQEGASDARVNGVQQQGTLGALHSDNGGEGVLKQGDEDFPQVCRRGRGLRNGAISSPASKRGWKTVVFGGDLRQGWGMLEVRYCKGVELPGLGLWLDPGKRQGRAFVSHAHSDHLGAHDEVLLTEATAALMRARIGGRRIERALAYGAATQLNGAVVRLLPAGHITGSAQIHLETEAGSLLYTGDFKLRGSRSAEACQWREADTLVMETTFGLPKYRMPPTRQVEEEVVHFCRESLEAGLTPVLFAYSLGKAQEAVWMLLENGLPPMLHSATYKMTEICRSLLPEFPGGYLPWDAARAAGRVLLLPPGRAARTLLQKLGPTRTAVLTGWALDPGARFRYGSDAAFAWSDHADYPDLLRYVELVQPKRVLTLHGFAAAFAADLRSRGIEAWALSQENQLELPF
jgi:putative mRNA 3-end processing factor